MRISVPPIWEIVLSVLATYALTGVIDHERPISSVWHLARAELTAPRPAAQPPTLRFTPSRVRIREPHHAATTDAAS